MLKKRKLGEMLLERNLITESDLEKALEYRKNHSVRIGRAFVELGYLTEEELLNFLSDQCGVEIRKLSEIQIKRELVDLLGEEFIKKYECFPFDKTENSLKILVSDPLNVVLEDEVKNITGLNAELYLMNEYDIKKLIEMVFDNKQIMDDLNLLEVDSEDDWKFNIEETMDNTPIIKIINSIFRDAIRMGASDIHIAVNEDDVDVRFRIDGILHEVKRLPKKAHLPITARIKMMANLDITEKRIPQDGSIRVNIENKDIDLRVSTLPSIYGEKIVIRILEKNMSIMRLDNIGFSEENLRKFRDLIHLPTGILLVTGPTGSGKSSTLYAVIHELNTVEVNIVTIEDPVEYKLKGITQVQVNSKIGLGFAEGLRSILRQDPNIILVGEIRDKETAEIAIRASNTGHLVFSTLHTNTAASTVLRLVDMGIEPYLVASTVIGVLNQRLVRKLCEKCKSAYELEKDHPYREMFNLDRDEKVILYKAVGCDYCNQTGYKGRIPIHELMVVNEKIRRMIIDGKLSKEIEECAVDNGMKTLKMDGLEKALKGLITLEEVRKYINVIED